MANEAMNKKIHDLEILSTEIRASAFETILNAESGHLGGNSSSVELMTMLYFGEHLRYDPSDPDNPNRDIVLVRGHEGPLRYKIFSMLGYIKEEELSTYRSLGSRLQGHESMRETPGVDLTPSGSLGMLLSYGVGAVVSYRERAMSNRAFIFLGDGEEQEGNVSEAARNASALELGNLICILDKNEKQLSGGTKRTDSKTNIAQTWRGYGWDVFSVSNGHDLQEIDDTLSEALSSDSLKPKMIIANTVKGFKLPDIEEHFSGAHTIGAYRNNQGVINTIKEQRDILRSYGVESKAQITEIVERRLPEAIGKSALNPSVKVNFEIDIETSEDTPHSLEDSQLGYFKQLKELIIDNPDAPHFYVITPDFVLEPLVHDAFRFEEYSTFIDVGIREQHAVAMGHGLSVSHPDSRVLGFFGDAFMYRCMDQLNAAAHGGSSGLIFAERAGITQGKNGSTHQTVSQPASILTMPDVHFKEPGDANDLYNVLNWFMTENPGWVYLRTHNNPVPPLEKEVQPGRDMDYYVVHDEEKDPDAIIAASGLTLRNSIDAAKLLKVSEDVNVRVINVIDPKSLDEEFTHLLKENRPVLTAYNGSPALLQMAVAKAIFSKPETIKPSLISGIGFERGTSGSVPDLEKSLKLDAESIAARVMQQLNASG